MTALTQAQEIPPPTEIYYKSDFPAWEFKERREKVIEAIGEDAVALIQGAGPVRGFGMFRQTNEMYYLTGIEVPRLYLLIDGRTGESRMFLPHRDERFERTEGKIISAEDLELVQYINGIDSLHGPEELLKHLKGAKIVYTPFEPGEGAAGSRDELRRSNRLIAEDPWDARVSREQLLQNLLKERIPGVEIRNLSPILDPLRVVKSDMEVDQLRKAGRLSALALIEAIKTTEPGVWEWELDAVAKYMFYVGGAQGLGYRSITASGPNINNGHYYRNNRRLTKDDMMLMDFAPDVGYYTSDIGRMWPVDGTYPAFMRELYGFVVEYHKIVLGVLRPGATVEQLQAEVQEKAIPLFEGWSWSKDIYKAAAKRMVDTGGGAFSHGVGMAVHDIGSYRRMGVLQPGMVFAIDPQLWVPEEDLYIRIEDTIAIRRGGYENLTGLAPTELDDVEALMREDGMLQRLPWKRKVWEISGRNPADGM
ncbi:MAG: aminopeptidase P family protein [Armatimonadetes bacterium]|nr:aminopeptidase P family protein [Armatimonadota bacterium]